MHRRVLGEANSASQRSPRAIGSRAPLAPRKPGRPNRPRPSKRPNRNRKNARARVIVRVFPMARDKVAIGLEDCRERFGDETPNTNFQTPKKLKLSIAKSLGFCRRAAGRDFAADGACGGLGPEVFLVLCLRLGVSSGSNGSRRSFQL